MGKRAMVIGLIGAVVLGMAGGAWAAEGSPLGRWNVMVENHPAWLAIERQGDKYVGRYLGGAGSVGGIGEVKVDGSKVEFKTGDCKWAGEVEGDSIKGTCDKGQVKGTWSGVRSVNKPNLSGTWVVKLVGVPTERPAVLELKQQDRELTGTYKDGDKKGEITEGMVNAGIIKFTVVLPTGKTIYMAAAKGDLLDNGMVQMVDAKVSRSFKGYRQRQWGEAIELFNGKDLDNWEQFGDPKKKNWKVVDGLMVTPSGDNIRSKDQFRNFRLHIEFMVPKGGNSGVYLRGRHEIQVADSIGSNPASWHDCGALYSRIAPAINACKKADEWQTYDITMIDNYVTVVFNGQVILDNEEVEGITGGMLDNNESAPGPIYLQGDHTAISYRKVTVWPAK